MKQLILLVGALRRGLRHAQLERLAVPSGLGGSAWALYGLVRSLRPTTVVEIGSAHGRSTCFIATALRDLGRGTLYAIDPHASTAWNDDGSPDTLAVLQKNLRWLGVQRHVQVLRQTSEQAAIGWDRPIDLLFIDGDHSYAGVQRDWQLFSAHVGRFGAVVFHDSLWELHPDPQDIRPDMGVPSFVEDLRAEGYPVLTLPHDFGVSIVQPTRGGVALRSC